MDWRECFIFETTIRRGRPHSMSNIWCDWNEESSINTLQIDIAQMRPLNIKYRTSVDLFFGWLTNWPNGDHWQNGNSNFFSFLFYKQIKVIRFSCYWLLFLVFTLCICICSTCVCAWRQDEGDWFGKVLLFLNLRTEDQLLKLESFESPPSKDFI